MRLSKITQLTLPIALTWGSVSHSSASAQPGTTPLPPVYGSDKSDSRDEIPSSTHDIIVTAQKRFENRQDVPISISAFTGAQLTEQGVFEIADLPRIVPTLRVGSGPGTVAARLNIRGIGSFGNSAIEPSVGVFLDGAYIPRSASIISTFLDIEGVEVLSGPQGTLFGRNASAGALTLRSAAPTSDFGAGVRVEAGTGDRYFGEAFVNVPVAEDMAIRAAGQVSLFNGYWTNDLTGDRHGGVDTYSGRLSVKWTPGPVTWIVRGDYSKTQGDSIGNWAFLPATVPPSAVARLTAIQGGLAPDLDPFDRNIAYRTDDDTVDGHHWGIASDLSLDLPGDFTLRLVSGYRDWKANETDDTVALAVPFYVRYVDWRSKSHGEDLQLISPSDTLLGGRLSFVGGLYYFREHLTTDYSFDFAPRFCSVLAAAVSPGIAAGCAAQSLIQAVDTPYDQITKSYAAYSQGTFKIGPTLDATLGARFTRDEKDALFGTVVRNPAGFLVASNETTVLVKDEERFTWRANLRWHPSETASVFATYSTGFKSGGFNNGASRVPLGQRRIFDAETVDNYEIGLKSQWFDRALTFNATLYRMDISGYQERAQDGVTALIRNVGDIRNQGVELDAVVRPTRGLRLNAGVAYLDSEFKRYPNAPNPPYIGGVQDLTGKRPSYTPKWSGNVGAELEGEFNTSLGWSLNGNLSFVSSQNVGASIDNSPLTVQPGYALVGARAVLYGPERRWSLAVFGENLTDKGFCSDIVYQVVEGLLGVRYPGGTPVRCIVGAPRRIGVSANMRF